MNRVSWRGIASLVLLTFVAGLGFIGSGARAEKTEIPTDRVLYKDVLGSVVDDVTGKPVAGAVVSLLYEMSVTGEDGAFRFEKVPLTHTTQVSLRVRSESGYIIGCMTVDVPVRFYPLAVTDGEKVDIQVVDPGSETPVELRLRSVSSDAVTAYCDACHDNNPCVEAATYEEVTKTKTDLRGIIVHENEVEEYTDDLYRQGVRAETYSKIRYQDTHPDGMNMEVIPNLDLIQYKGQYQKPANLSLFDGKYVTCDTCHTRHVPTEQSQYVVMPYEETNTLCMECHL